MLSAAKSDGKIDEGEKEKILGQLGDIDPQEMQFVRDELSAPLDVEGLVRDVPNGMEQQAYLMSVMGIDLDSADEARYLDGLAKALGIDAAEIEPEAPVELPPKLVGAVDGDLEEPPIDAEVAT